MVLLVGASCLGVAAFLWSHGTYPDFWTALRHASFNLVSMATDCGYASVDFDKWPAFAPLWMLFLSCLAVSSGSTGGGIKMMRTVVLYKQARRELVRLLHPNAVDVLKLGNDPVPNKVAFAVLGFIFLYATTIAAMSFILLLSGLDVVSAVSAVIACINNAGPGLNVVGPAQNYASLSDFQTWVLAATMLLGRLEILSVVVIFTPHFWRK
jgi:trk system potassium uptake protein TrkH